MHSYAELARLGRVSRPRISQILNLLNLAPDIQEALLLLPRIERGRDAIILRALQPVASTPDWHQQRRLWAALQTRAEAARPTGGSREACRGPVGAGRRWPAAAGRLGTTPAQARFSLLRWF